MLTCVYACVCSYACVFLRCAVRKYIKPMLYRKDAELHDDGPVAIDTDNITVPEATKEPALV